MAAALTVLAVAGKLAGGILGAWGGGGGPAPRPRRRSAVAVGVGLVPRGEVGLLVAGAGRAYGAVPEPVFAAVVLMSLVTTLLAAAAGAALPHLARDARPGGRRRAGGARVTGARES